MTDRNARDVLAVELRRLITGRITNDEFEDRVAAAVRRSSDAGVRAVRWAAWALYNDLREHRLVGEYAPTPLVRRRVAIWLLFLKSDAEYEWVDLPFWLQQVLGIPNLLTFGLVNRVLRLWQRRQGDCDAWPFIRHHDLTRAVTEWLPPPSAPPPGHDRQ